MSKKNEAGYELIVLTIAGSDNTKALFKSSMDSKDMSEEDKINQMLSDSGDYYNQKNWQQLRGRSAYAGQRVPATYKCNRCGQGGHFIYDCPMAGKLSNLPSEMKRTTGIPRSFLQPATVDTPGAKLNPQGMYFSMTTLVKYSFAQPTEYSCLQMIML